MKIIKNYNGMEGWMTQEAEGKRRNGSSELQNCILPDSLPFKVLKVNFFAAESQAHY